MNEYKAYTFKHLPSVPQIANLNTAEKEAMQIVAQVFPFKTNNYVIENLIDWSNIPEDPIYTLNFPRKEMLRANHFSMIEKALRSRVSKEEMNRLTSMIRMELNPDTGGQSYNIPLIDGMELSGVQHKYRETVLFFPSQGQTCHAYCSFCFRWPQFSGIAEMKFAARETDLLKRYLLTHKEVTDILFTGGDPLIMKTQKLQSYIEPLLSNDLPHIQTIRIGTKALSYWPYRFTTDHDSDDLMRLFEKISESGRNLSIMAHINHPVELSTKAVEEAITRIRSTGAQIRTQSPVLNHINNSPAVWAEMWRRQVNLNMVPYYMFVARDTGARHFFAVPLAEAWRIFRNAYQKVSGICRTVRGPSMSSTPGKIQILGVSEISGEKIFVLRFIQGRDPNWAARPFFAKFDENALWLSDLKPAFDEDKFFFEEELNSIFREKSSTYDIVNFEESVFS